MPYEVLSHTADTGIEAHAGTLADLIADLAAGMFALMAAPDPPSAEAEEVELEVGAATPEELVVEVLSELLYESEVENLLFYDFDVEPQGELRMRVTGRGIPLSEVDLEGPPIKAVTYHDVAVTKTGDDWYGRIYFDV